MPVIINPDVINGGFDFPGLQQWLGGHVEFLFVGAGILIIAFVLRKGKNNQTKNELIV